MSEMPESFIEDEPPSSFEPDASSGEITVGTPQSLSVHSLSRFAGLELSGSLHGDLDRAIASGNGGLIYNWFKRTRSKSRAETNLTRAAEISSISALIITYATEAANAQRLPHVLAQRHRLEDVQFSVAEKTGLAALILTDAATKAGLTVELYLKQLDKEVELDSRKKEIEQDLHKDRQLKTNAAVDEKRRAQDKIEVLSTAKNVTRQQEKRLRADLREAYARKDEITRDTKISATYRQDLLDDVTDEISKLKRRIDELGQDVGKADGRVSGEAGAGS
jgi:hypothetical protein